MTQQVFDNAMTAHVWAAQEQHAGRSHNGNLYFEGRALYSYGSHYVVGYVAPGPLYLINADSSTMTTNGKHKPAAWRAIDYGRNNYGNHATVPDLTEIAGIFDRLDSDYINKAEAQRALARHMESSVDTWPGQDSACLLYRAAGLAGPKAFAKAKAGQKRVAMAEEKRRDAQERAALNAEARTAKYMARNVTTAEAAKEVRDLLQEAAKATRYQQERKEAEAAEESRSYFRAAKAAKAKGWTRVAAHCRACYKATRVELCRYRDHAQRYQERAAVWAAIQTLRGMESALRDVAQSAQYRGFNRAMDSLELTADEKARRCQAIAGAYAAQIDAGRTVTGSPFAWAMGPGGLARLNKTIANLEALKAQSLAVAGRHMQAAQAEARALWLAGDDSRGRAGYGWGRLVDSEGGALLRAEGVTRDGGGQIVGGTLRTSWAATVPLAHALRAFQFLKLCRAKGTAWAANGRTIRVGHFRIDSIDAKGNLVAGCHRINWQEVARLAALLGVDSLAADDSALESRVLS